MDKVVNAVQKAHTDKKDLQKKGKVGEQPQPQAEIINPQSGMNPTICVHCGKQMPGSKNKQALE